MGLYFPSLDAVQFGHPCEVSALFEEEIATVVKNTFPKFLLSCVQS